MNLIWIVADTFRRDHLGCYGNSTIHTSSLDAFREKCMRFDRHYAAGFPTMPCRADFFTGRWTSSFMKWEPLPQDEVTLAQVIRKADVHAAAVVDTPFYLLNDMNYDRGFHTFIEIQGQDFSKSMLGVDIRKLWRYESDRFAPQTFKRAAEWLEQHYKDDFFLYVDTWDPHESWDAPDYYTELYWPDYDGEEVFPAYAHWQDIPGMTEEQVNKAHACYCGEITMVDTWVGHLLRQVENMGLMEKTAIIFTTDHGFHFGEHGGLFGKTVRAKPSATPFYQDPAHAWTHSPLYEEIVNCPLLIYVPGMDPGEYAGLTSAVDLMPTVLDIMDQEIPERVEGRSLLPRIKNTGTSGRDYVISTASFTNPGTVVRDVDDRERKYETGSDTTITTEEWSLLYNMSPGKSMLFHLGSDPKQEKNVIGQHPDVAKELHQLFVQFMKETNVAREIQEPRLELKM